MLSTKDMRELWRQSRQVYLNVGVDLKVIETRKIKQRWSTNGSTAIRIRTLRQIEAWSRKRMGKAHIAVAILANNSYTIHGAANGTCTAGKGGVAYAIGQDWNDNLQHSLASLVHEIGHSLGAVHMYERPATMMNPNFSSVVQDSGIRLSNEDLENVYGCLQSNMSFVR